MLLKKEKRRRLKSEKKFDSGQLALVGLSSVKKNLKMEKNKNLELKNKFRDLKINLAQIVNFIFENLKGVERNQFFEMFSSLERNFENFENLNSEK